MGKYSLSKVPSEVLLSTAQKIRDIRKQVKLTQSELAYRSGVSYGSVKRFELSGQISLESFLKILLMLNQLDRFDALFQKEEDLSEIEKLFSDKFKTK